MSQLKRLFGFVVVVVVLATQAAFANHIPHVTVKEVSEVLSPSEMRGVHMILWDDSDTRYKDVYFDWLKSYGINSIMLDFGWNKLEPTKGVYDPSYLDKMDRFVQKAEVRGIYVALRMHKWTYPIAYQSRDPSDAWILGYPAWLNKTPDFWEDVGNCWDNYVAMWVMLAARYKNEHYVAAFDLFGEPGNDVGPGIYGNTGRKVMEVLFDKGGIYERTINSIHSTSKKLVVIEAFGGQGFRYVKNNSDMERTVPRRPSSEDFAIGQSVYESYQLTLEDNEAVARSWNVPFIATEFGVSAAEIASPSPQEAAWVEGAIQEFAARNMGWFYWQFGPGPNGSYALVLQKDDSSSPILRRLSTGICGFPFESLLIGGALGILFVGLRRKRPSLFD